MGGGTKRRASPPRPPPLKRSVASTSSAGRPSLNSPADALPPMPPPVVLVLVGLPVRPLSVAHSVGFALIRAADFSVKSAQAPRTYRQARIKTIWRGSTEWICLGLRRCLTRFATAAGCREDNGFDKAGSRGWWLGRSSVGALLSRRARKPGQDHESGGG